MINFKRPYLPYYYSLVGLSLAINGCDYITGEAIKVPARFSPRW